MSDELKACPFCEKQPQGNNWHTYGKSPKDEMRYFCANPSCPNASYTAKTLAEWNTRPIEDSMRAELAAARAELAAKDAEIERLRKALAAAYSGVFGYGR